MACLGSSSRASISLCVNTGLPARVTTLSDVKLRVRFDGGATGFTAGERVALIGKLAAVAKKCTASGSPASPVFRTIVVHPATA